MTKDTCWNLFIIAAIAFSMLVLDRMWRITPILEAFQGGAQAKCGVDMPPCAHLLRCINGYCKSENLPYFPKQTDLPVLP